MPGSFGMLSTPQAMITKRARISSPRLVATRQRLIASSQRSEVISVWNSALSAKPNLSRDELAIFVDLRAVGELLRRHEARLFEQRQVAIGVVVALDAGIAVPVPDAAEVAGVIDDCGSWSTPALRQVIGGQDARPTRRRGSRRRDPPRSDRAARPACADRRRRLCVNSPVGRTYCSWPSDEGACRAPDNFPATPEYRCLQGAPACARSSYPLPCAERVNPV